MSYTEPTTTPVEAWAIALLAITVAQPVLDAIAAEQAALEAYEDGEFYNHNSAPAYDSLRDNLDDTMWNVIDVVVSEGITFAEAAEDYDIITLPADTWIENYWDDLLSAREAAYGF